MNHANELAMQDAVLGDLQKRFQIIYSHSDLASQAIGLRKMDLELTLLGRRVLAGLQSTRPAPTASEGRPDVYLATQLPDIGGHSRLLKDFVHALHRQNDPHEPWLLVTDIHQCAEGPLPSGGCGELGFQPDHVRILRGASPAAKLQALFSFLLELRPGRIFLFHHPDDPVPIAAIQPDLAAKIFLVHHSDSIPCFGLYVPEVHAIELHPTGAAMSRLIGVPHDFLLLSAPDPGPRPHNFLLEHNLVTATSGRSQKFEREYFYGYPETVGVILRATGGRHVHFGPLGKQTLDAISRTMADGNIPADRFVHVPSVPSISTALWENHCDVYLSSFPVDGARTNAEVAASGTLIINHSWRQTNPSPEDPLKLRGSLKWKTWDDLTEILHQCRDRDFLSARSAEIRTSYEHLHHPDFFKETLHKILSGEGGISDPLAQFREMLRTRSLLRALASATIQHTVAGGETGHRLQELYDTNKLQADHIAVLQDDLQSLSRELEAGLKAITNKMEILQNAMDARDPAEKIKALRVRVGKIQEERTALRRAKGWRARLRRWLMQC